MIRLSLALLMLLSLSSCANPKSANDSAKDELLDAIEKNWMIPIGMPNIDKCTSSLRLHLTPDGVVTGIDVLQENDDPACDTVAESAKRAVLITQAEAGHLPVSRGNYNPTIVVRWPMKLICAERGGC